MIRWKASSVTSVCPIQKPLVRVTWWAGFSSSSQSLSPAEQPMVNVPGGIHTYVSPSFRFTLVSPARRSAFWPEREKVEHDRLSVTASPRCRHLITWIIDAPPTRSIAPSKKAAAGVHSAALYHASGLIVKRTV